MARSRKNEGSTVFEFSSFPEISSGIVTPSKEDDRLAKKRSEAAKKGAATLRKKRAEQQRLQREEIDRVKQEARERERRIVRDRDRIEVRLGERARKAERELEDLRFDMRTMERTKASQIDREVRKRVREELPARVKRVRENEIAREKVKKASEGAKAFNSLVPASVASMLPFNVDTIVREIVAEPSMRDGIVEMMGRERDFKTPFAALMAGIAILPESSRHFDNRLDEIWSSGALPPPDTTVDELIIGAGLHGAIYASVRAAEGHPRPLVIDVSNRIGGVFAVSKSPSFYLNSRNRPGGLSLPGQDGALNVLPAALVQPADLVGAEYPTNDVLGWAIRTSLAMFADVVPNVSVGSVEASGYSPRGGRRYRITLTNGIRFFANRVILATGLSKAKTLLAKPHPRVLSFAQFMAKQDEKFPLRDMNKVAVIGGGDSGKTAIEALTGQGPSTKWSVASVDWIEKIDWYGCGQQSREDWVRCNRSRYRRIGSLLPSFTVESDDEDGYFPAQQIPNVPFRVQPRPGASRVTPGYDCVYVDERPYDYVVECIGFDNDRAPILIGNDTALPVDPFFVNGRESARRYFNNYEGVFVVGPAANLPLTTMERAALGQAGAIKENETSLFRYASRTAALASLLEPTS